jgi:hypothetical protein
MATLLQPKPELTFQRLREVLRYNRKTGVFHWRVSPRRRTKVGDIAGGMDVWGYWIIGIDHKRYRRSRLAWLYVYGEWPRGELDHKDTIKHHDAIANLREATQTQNNANRRPYSNNSSGLKGAYRHFQNDCWYSTLKVGSRTIYLGCYATAAEAHAAYMAKAKEVFGEFARAQ